MAERMLVVVSTPRKGGNSEVAAEHVARGFEDGGGSVRRVLLRDLSVHPCRACNRCRETGRCVIEDDMQDLYPEILAADVLVLSTPIYWWGVSAQLKTFIDRWYALAVGEQKLLRGKQAVLVFSFADDEPSTPQWAEGMLRTALGYSGAAVAGCVNVVAAGIGDAERKCISELKKAYRLGRSFRPAGS